MQALLLVPLSMYAMALPAESARLVRAAAQSQHALGGAAHAGLVGVVLAPGLYAGVTLTLEALLTSAFSAAALLISWRRPTDRVTLFITVTLVSFGALVPPALASCVAVLPQ